MAVLLFLIPVSVGLAALFVVFCIRAIRQGQFDDMESPAWRMLFDPPHPTALDTSVIDSSAMRKSP